MNEDPRVEAAERRAEVVRLRQEHLTFQEIGGRLGFTKQRAHQIFRAACAAVVSSAVEALRADHLAETAEAREVLMAVMRRDHLAHSNGRLVTVEDDKGETHPVLDDGPKVDAARALAVIQAREAKLVGADQAEKLDASLSGGLRYEVIGISPGDVV